MIWEYYICGNPLHIALAEPLYTKAQHGRLVGIRCEKDPGTFSCNHCWGRNITSSSTYPKDEPLYYTHQGESCRAEKVGFVSLLCTCRFIYTEIIDMIYTRNRFEFNHLDSILSLSQTLLVQRLNQIRSVRLTFNFPRRHHEYEFDYNSWVEVCNVLAGMSGLEDLSLHLHGLAIPVAHNNATIFDPLRIRQAKVFDVHVLWGVFTPVFAI